MTSFKWMSTIYYWEGHSSLIGMLYMMVMQIHTLLTKDGVFHKLNPLIKEGERYTIVLGYVLLMEENLWMA